jgi:hypothetical protein
VISTQLALRVIARRAAQFNFGYVLPDDVRRLGVVGLVALAHNVQGTGVTYDHIRDAVTITLPGVPTVAGQLLSRVPVVGAELESIARQEGRTTVYLSSFSLLSGEELLATWFHEEGHVGSIARGGYPYCLSYLLVPELRAAGEAPCYGASMAVLAAFGRNLDDLVRNAKLSLDGYGLPDASRKLAHTMVDSAADTIRRTGDFGGIVA